MGFTPTYISQGPYSQYAQLLETQHHNYQNLTPLETQFPTPPENQYPTPPESQYDDLQHVARQPRRIGQSDTEEEEDDDDVQEVEETSAEEEDVRGKGKQRTKRLLWNRAEVLALAKSWIDISEDATTANDQSITAFKDRIWQLWCVRMGREYRNPAQIYSKWRNVSKVAKDFEAIYEQGQRNWPSGATEADVLAKAKEVYDETHGRNPFNLQAETFWKTIRVSEKWKAQKTFHEFACTKRVRRSTSIHSQSSDANIGFDMNFSPEESPSPMGRDAAKRKMRAGSGTTSNASNQSTEGVRQLGEQLADLQNMQTNITSQMLTVEANKHRKGLLKLLLRNTSKLTGYEKKLAILAKAEAAKELGFPPPPEDSE